MTNNNPRRRVLRRIDYFSASLFVFLIVGIQWFPAVINLKPRILDQR
jgi:hypothetical protein